MDHGNLAVVEKKPYPERTCRHGKCCQHNPDWENIGKTELRPAPWFFGLLKTCLIHWCCGRPLVCYKKVQDRRCRKCGRVDEHVDTSELGLCLCCGYHTNTYINWGPR